jgi:hypothetical protein
MTMSRHVNTSGDRRRPPWQTLGGGGAAVLLGALLPWLSFSAAGLPATARHQVLIVGLSVTLIAAGLAPRPALRPALRRPRLTAGAIALALTALTGLFCALS